MMSTGRAGRVHRQRRAAGLCIWCGLPAVKVMYRSRQVNLRLAGGRGLQAEYASIIRGWKPGDFPPTLERLSTIAFCAVCLDRREKGREKGRQSRQLAEEERERQFAEEEREERSRDSPPPAPDP
jgi:hypothetical protein